MSKRIHPDPQQSGTTGMGALVLGATGVVFGDIGTSPIYALKETFHKSGTTLTDIYGVVSLVFWTLMLVVTLKYLAFVMRADNRGEGGILALMALLPERFREARTGREKSLLMLVLIGTALLFGDGVITPAISVLSATEGLALVNENFADYSVPITVAILVALFAVQRKGTHSIGRVFGPIMVTWFGFLAVLGLYRFLEHPQVIVSLSPTYALGFLVSHGTSSLLVLSSVILCVTGAEALYADMGHFGVRPIRLAWGWLVGPSLVLCYLGQAAVVAQHPEAAQSPFFSLTPGPGWTLVLVLLATAATVIASQALITGVFSLTRQATSLRVFPRLRVLHTNTQHEGQIYVPAVNWTLGVATIALVLLFRTSSALADAYVLAIAGTMAITTVAFHRVAADVWGWSRARLWPLTAVFLTVDLGFLAGTAGNIVKGGWVPIVMGAVVLTVMLIWRLGFSALTQWMQATTVSWSSLAAEIDHGSITRVPGIGVYLASPKEEVPAAMASQARILHSIPAEVYVVTIEVEQQAYVEDRVDFHEVLPRVTRVFIHIGYMQSADVPKVLNEHFIRERERVATYYISERHFLATDANRVRRLPERLFEVLHRNEAPVATYFNLPGDRLISIGTRIDL